MIVGVINSSIIVGTLYFAWDYHPVDLWSIAGASSMPLVAQSVVLMAALVAVDMYVYGIHWLGHKVRWVWADHMVHHSSQHMNITVGLRVPLTASIAGIYFLIFPLPLLGFSPELVLLCYGVNLVYQVGLHTQVIGWLPRWYEAVFMTPSHHRVHHAVNPRYLDKNFGGMFVFSDKLFGTFAEEDPNDPCRYGMVRNIGTTNVARVASVGWVELFHDLTRSDIPLQARLMYLFGPPGWSHSGDHWRTKDVRLGSVSTQSE